MRFCVSCCFQFKKTKKKTSQTSCHKCFKCATAVQSAHALSVHRFSGSFQRKVEPSYPIRAYSHNAASFCNAWNYDTKKQNKTKEHYNIHRVFHLDAKGPSTVYTAKALWMCTLRTDEFGPVTATITVKLHMREYKRLRKSYTALVTVNRLGGTLLGAF